MSRGFDWETTTGAHWSKREKDWMVGGPTNATRALLAFDLIGSDTFKNLVKELDERGFDTETLRFSVKKKKSELSTEEEV